VKRATAAPRPIPGKAAPAPIAADDGPSAGWSAWLRQARAGASGGDLDGGLRWRLLGSGAWQSPLVSACSQVFRL